jgi:hypothetical protein
MSHKVDTIPCLRVTAIGYDPVNQREYPCTKICHNASVAADHYALVRNAHWGYTTTLSYAKKKQLDGLNQRLFKLERRVLKVFKQYLP